MEVKKAAQPVLRHTGQGKKKQPDFTLQRKKSGC